eukprot:752057-Alexandrium_andersonii.AAC.1
MLRQRGSDSAAGNACVRSALGWASVAHPCMWWFQLMARNQGHVREEERCRREAHRDHPNGGG